jgi:hypothetical protein
LIELKDIQDIKKEKSKRGVFSDAIKLITKDKQEVNLLTFYALDSDIELLTRLGSISFPICSRETR